MKHMAVAIEVRIPRNDTLVAVGASTGRYEEIREGQSKRLHDGVWLTSGMAVNKYAIAGGGNAQTWHVVVMGWADCLETVPVGTRLLATLGYRFGHVGKVRHMRLRLGLRRFAWAKVRCVKHRPIYPGRIFRSSFWPRIVLQE